MQVDSTLTGAFSPNLESSISILRELHEGRIIKVSLELSGLRHILNPEKPKFQYYLNLIRWPNPLNHYDDEAKKFLAQLDNKIRSKVFLKTSYDDVVALCKELAVMESCSFLIHMGDEFKLPIKIGPKTITIIERAVTTYSVAQVYNFIWRACKFSAKYARDKNIPSIRAANAVIGNIERSMDRALADNWEIKAFRRNHALPQSIVSRVLFNDMLHTNDGGFHQVISDIL